MSYRIKNLQIARRRASGQSLVQGVLAIMLLVGLAVAAVLFLSNVGMTIYYKEKLTFAANQAAQYAFTQAAGPVRKAQTETFVKEFLTAIGLTPQNTKVEVDDTGSVNGQPVIKVSVVNNCNLLGSGNLLPAFITMSSTGYASDPGTVVGQAGPPGPPGPRGPIGPTGPPGRLAPLDPALIRKAVGINGYGAMWIYRNGGLTALWYPIFDSTRRQGGQYVYTSTLVYSR